MKWKRKDGRLIDIKDMGTAHLNNAVVMLRLKGFVTDDEFLSCLAYACAGDTPDGAASAAEGELANMKVWHGLADMEAELANRRTK